MAGCPFPVYEIKNGDFFVADYTNSAPPRGVEVFDVSPSDIQSLHFYNPAHVEVIVANMEHNKFLCKRPDGNPSRQCECICVSNIQVSHPWMVLIELKYCLEHNIGVSFDDAIFKLKEHHKLLRDVKNVIHSGYHNLYWAISMPSNADKAPFGSFMFDESARLDVFEQYDGVTILSYNDIMVDDEEHLSEYIVGS
jgi:hypothetical protein